MLTTTEAGEINGERLGTSDLAKKLISGDPIRGRAMHENDREIPHCGKWSIAINERPSIGGGHAARRRWRFVHYTFRPDPRIPDLEVRLMAEGPGILHKILGASEAFYQLGGLPPLPGALEADQADIRAAGDPLADWYAQCTEEAPFDHVLLSTATESFTAYCEANAVTARWVMALEATTVNVRCRVFARRLRNAEVTLRMYGGSTVIVGRQLK